eukprot:scaffold298_cov247-Pinguiococcus_pyrenoidosus.AAC.26
MDDGYDWATENLNFAASANLGQCLGGRAAGHRTGVFAKVSVRGCLGTSAIFEERGQVGSASFSRLARTIGPLRRITSNFVGRPPAPLAHELHL